MRKYWKTSRWQSLPQNVSQGNWPLCQSPISMKFGTETLWDISIHVTFILSALKRFKVLFFAFKVWKFTLFFAFQILTVFLLFKFESLNIFKIENYSTKNIQFYLKIILSKFMSLHSATVRKQKRPQREWIGHADSGAISFETRKTMFVTKMKIICPRRLVTTQGSGNVECTCVCTH